MSRGGRATVATMLALCGVLGGCIDLGDRPWVLEPDARAAGVGSDAAGVDGGLGVDGAGGGAGLQCPHEGGAPREYRVVMKANRFVPDRVEICAGDIVFWRNDDTKEHTVYSGEPGAPDGAFQSAKIYLGQSWSRIFPTPGTWTYYCSTHKKKMHGARVVVR